MTDDFDQAAWDERWAAVLRDHPDVIANRPPNELLVSTAGGLSPGRALDAGCGHGAETLWLAARGWRVTAVDFAAAALDSGRGRAGALGADVAERIDWVQGDLGAWMPEPAAYDLVVSLYVHVAGSVEAMVGRLAAGVAPGGTLLLVGHLPVDPDTGEPSPAAGQTQVTVDAALGALDLAGWELVVTEDRRRPDDGSGADAVIHARRRAG